MDCFGLNSYTHICKLFLIRGRIDLFRAVRDCANNFELSKSSFQNGKICCMPVNSSELLDVPEALTWAKLLFGLTIRLWPTLWTAWFYWQSAVTTCQDVRQVSGCTMSFLPEKIQMRETLSEQRILCLALILSWLWTDHAFWTSFWLRALVTNLFQLVSWPAIRTSPFCALMKFVGGSHHVAAVRVQNATFLIFLNIWYKLLSNIIKLYNYN